MTVVRQFGCSFSEHIDRAKEPEDEQDRRDDE
jgi:hypothetical protein